MSSNIRQYTFWGYLFCSVILVTLSIVFLFINKGTTIILTGSGLLLSIIAYGLGVKWSHLAKALKKISRYFMGIWIILIILWVFA